MGKTVGKNVGKSPSPDSGSGLASCAATSFFAGFIALFTVALAVMAKRGKRDN